MAEHSTDPARELLFGILALQVGMIDQAQLVAACKSWAVEKDRGLAEHLAELGAISTEARSAIDALVSVHVQRHDKDPARSLAAIQASGKTIEQLELLGDPELTATLTHVASGSSDAQGIGATESPRLNVGAESPRFRVLRPLARGGLGAVFVAIDAELSREVALKQLLDHHADDPISRQRFLLEAEITGGLEHPGIVPVYGLGTYGDGRPYYAMRFVQGESLKDAIARFHAEKTRSVEFTRHDMAFRELLGRLLDVCNAMAYAHSRGVIHRDLKPSNLMLGPYGETLVVDWGLAKTQQGAEEAFPDWVMPSRGGDPSTETISGSVLGTPGYMSPEQACGDLERIGPASDIYGLGATLFALLTNAAPVEGGSTRSILDRVVRGEIRSPRAVNPRVPRSLEAICRKAMALNPSQRYASARELADEIQRWLADEPVLADHEPLAQRLGRWLRRHRLVASVVAGCGLTGLACAGVAILLLQRSAWEAQRQRQIVQNYEATTETMVALLEEMAREIDSSGFQQVSLTTRVAESGSQPQLEPAADSIEPPGRGRTRELPLGQPRAISESPPAAASAGEPRNSAVTEVAVGEPSGSRPSRKDRYQQAIRRLESAGRSEAANRVRAMVKAYDARVTAELGPELGGELGARGEITPTMLGD